jgi:photosystem II stability/assembly factor-like uncharacterized protein
MRQEPARARRGRLTVGLPDVFAVVHVVLGLLCLLALAGPPWRRSFAQVDVLERPAHPDPEAATKLLLAVTRAGRRLVAAGERGIVLLSDDAGRTWRQGRVPVSSTLVALCFPDSLRGWAVGHHGVILRTGDGGASWRRQPDADGEATLFDVAFTGAGRGFIVGAYGMVLATVDGGDSWRPWHDHLAGATDRHLYGVRGEGAHVYLVGEQGALYRSIDAGETFAPLRSPHPASFFGLLVSGPRVLIYGLRGRLFVSPDRGETWQAAASTTSASLTAGTQLEDGSFLLATQVGQLLLGGPARPWVELPNRQPAAVLDLVGTGDGALVVVGVRGLARLPGPGAAR